MIEPPPPEAPKVIAPPPTLGRADLLAAAAAAASSYAAGIAPEGADPLAGRSFTIRTPFGCLASAGETKPGLASAALRAKTKTVELSLTPADWAASPLAAAAVEAKVWDAVEGYWIDRPWLQTEACPQGSAAVEDAPASTPSPQTVGLAAVFEPQGSRFGRRNGRAYSFTARGERETPPVAPANGYRLVLEGRFAAFPDGRAIRCRADSADQRPVCIAAVQLDRVAFEDGDTGGQISEWRKD
ncbi:MAG: hypothetical protein C0481_14900 [Phenylobacterium sp.]|uniref:hypothetical protein n=1 Tax=Phenylobacterium sp. TaxID=1871053 RepID=UPI0025D780FE|nr:hypothetical protein [Phenylobacterium sp.]MBA4013152.1 hypothetical protein [Phenylobacterium sp.]